MGPGLMNCECDKSLRNVNMVQLNFESVIKNVSQQVMLDCSATSLILHSATTELFKKLLYPGGQSSRCIFSSRGEMKFYHVSKQGKKKTILTISTQLFENLRCSVVSKAPEFELLFIIKNPRINLEKSAIFLYFYLLFNNLQRKKAYRGNAII